MRARKWSKLIFFELKFSNFDCEDLVLLFNLTRALALIHSIFPKTRYKDKENFWDGVVVNDDLDKAYIELKELIGVAKAE